MDPQIAVQLVSFESVHLAAILLLYLQKVSSLSYRYDTLLFDSLEPNFARGIKIRHTLLVLKSQIHSESSKATFFFSRNEGARLQWRQNAADVVGMYLCSTPAATRPESGLDGVH